MSKGKTRAQYLGSTGYISSDKYMDWDFLYETSTTRNPLYNIGDRVALADGRAFRYGKTYSGMVFSSMKCAMTNINILVAEKTSPTCIPTSAIAAGAHSAAFTVSAGTIGTDRNGVIAVDELRGGYISLYLSSSDRPQRGIIGNTALAAAGTSITLYFDAAFPVEVPASTQTEIMANPYSRLTNANDYSSGNSAWMGMATVVPAVSSYVWIQTWGIYRCSPIGAGVGTMGAHEFMFASNGGIRNSQASIVTSALSEQHAGFLMDYPITASAEDAAPFINLQINP